MCDTNKTEAMTITTTTVAANKKAKELRERKKNASHSWNWNDKVRNDLDMSTMYTNRNVVDDVTWSHCDEIKIITPKFDWNLWSPKEFHFQLVKNIPLVERNATNINFFIGKCSYFHFERKKMLRLRAVIINLYFPARVMIRSKSIKKQ